MLEQTNTLLSRAPIGLLPPVICFLTGSSGCGKTHLATALNEQFDPEKAAVYFFDRIGIPTVEQMISEFGSTEKWQEVTTHKWVKRLSEIRDKALVVFEGQYHPKFALDAANELGLKDFKIAVVTADPSIWEARLRGPREQPNLVTDEMRNWARFLREETIRLRGADTSASNLDSNLQEVAALINPMLAARITG
jgi:energy-coupling factor transporter ATP-binding protein EcfA2